MAEPQKLKLPSAPRHPLYYFEEDNYPQPKLHRNLDKGMAASIGRLRKCNIFDYKFNVLSHNTIMRSRRWRNIKCRIDDTERLF